ncbi:MAG: polysaccharide deacetylase family protein [Rubrivivax sp.]|nr:polysaccharide deacetylase family protein [Rubrivivax sp.]
MNALLRRLFAARSPAGTGARLSTLIFHRVHRQTDPLFPDEVDAARFDRMCGWLAAWFHVLRFDEAVHRLRAGTLPERALAITFDDGYADNHEVALPILSRHGLPATFFVTTDYLGGGVMWNDRITEAIRRTDQADLDPASLGIAGLRRLGIADLPQRRFALQALISAVKYLESDARMAAVEKIEHACGGNPPGPLMMQPEQVVALNRAGMLIGAHTKSHPILARLDIEQAGEEIAGSRRVLEELLGVPVRTFAYPNGRPNEDYGPEAVGLVAEAGFEAACTTARGTADASTSPLEIPRFTPWDRSRLRFGLRLARHARDTATPVVPVTA